MSALTKRQQVCTKRQQVCTKRQQVCTKRQQVCSMCQAEPDDMLILTCRHNLCLECATQLYNLNTKNNHIICEICLSSTPLDSDTIVCLRSLSAKALNQKPQHTSSYTQNNHLNLHQNIAHVYPPMPKTHHYPRDIHQSKDLHQPKEPYQTMELYYQLQQLPQIQQQQVVQKCQKHNEPLTYFCLQCNIYTICSQCMLLQNHRYHKVVTIKKASVQIRQTIQKLGRQKLKLKTLLEKDKEGLNLRKQESQKQLELNLAHLKSVFDSIINLIQLKYQQLKKLLEQQAQRKLQIMQGAINQIQQKITLIQDTVQFQDELIKSCTGQQINGIFKMFDYYESQVSKNSLSFEPSLPNFISEVKPQRVLNKDKIFQGIQAILTDFIISPEQIQQQASQDNIHLISQIENDNINLFDVYRQKRSQFSIKSSNHQQNIPHNQLNIPHHQQNICITNDILSKRPISQKINIVHVVPQSKYGISQRKQINQIQMKNPKNNIQAIKRKVRQNLKDRQLSNSRKMELSRSIENANDLLNKIQQRTSKI